MYKWHYSTNIDDCQDIFFGFFKFSYKDLLFLLFVHIFCLCLH